jgi:hypothetical protein
MHETMQNKRKPFWGVGTAQRGKAGISPRKTGKIPRKWDELRLGGIEFNLAFFTKEVYDIPCEESRRSFVLRPGF